MRFHFDENVSEGAAIGLRGRGVDVTVTSEEGLRGVPDEEQLAFALGHGRVLITHDDDLLRIAGGGTPHAGIGYCAMNKYSVGGLVRRLVLLAASVSDEDMRNRTEYL